MALRPAPPKARTPPERVGLSGLELLEPVENRPTELEQGCKRQLGLRLHTAGAEDEEIACARNCVFEERRLADPRLADQDERSAHPLARRVEQNVDASLLVAASDQHVRSVGRLHPRDKTGDLPGANA